MVAKKDRYNASALAGDDVVNAASESKVERTRSTAIRQLTGSSKAKSGVQREREKADHEIARIKSEAEETIKALKKEAEAANDAVERLQKQHEEEKQGYLDQFKNLKGRVGGATSLKLSMPITKQDVSFELLKIDPALIDISPENERDQEFLDEISLRDLLPDIKKHGQTKPGLVRPKADGRFELIEGSRRRRTAEILGIKFEAFSGHVPDADVRVLSVSENIKKDVSPYEKGLAYKKQMLKGEFESWAELAAVKGISTSHASRLKMLADLAPRFVKILPTPSSMSTKYGEMISSLRKKNETALEEKVSELLALRENVSSPKEYPDYDNVIKQLKSAVRLSIPKPTQYQPALYSSKNGECHLKHSLTNKGSTKLELEGASDAQVAKIIKMIGKELKLNL